MATPQTKSNYLEQEIKFLQAVENRTKKDNGAKAAFKRAMSGEAEHVRRVYQFVLPYVGNASVWEQNNIWIPIACLVIYYPQPIGDTEHRRNFGYSCSKLSSGTTSEGTDRRFRALLDLSLTDIQSPLTALVRQMKSRKPPIPIDYPQLLSDLLHWEHANQYIQDRWARTFWSVDRSVQSNEKEETAMSE